MSKETLQMPDLPVSYPSGRWIPITEQEHRALLQERETASAAGRAHIDRLLSQCSVIHFSNHASNDTASD